MVVVVLVLLLENYESKLVHVPHKNKEYLKGFSRY